MHSTGALLHRIHVALDEAAEIFSRFDQSTVAEMKKSGGDPLTEVDLAIDEALREALLQPGEGWLSEETADDHSRLGRDLVWVVDPLDGTREFIDGLPEFCTSVAAVVDGRPVAGGILNPAAGLRIAGASDIGVEVNGRPGKQPTNSNVLASRSEWTRGTWALVERAGLDVVPMGSVAYKFARVAAGLDLATWTPVPKHEWDVAGGAALLDAIGGEALDLKGMPLRFNKPNPWMSGAVAAPPWFDSQRDKVYSLIGAQINRE